MNLENITFEKLPEAVSYLIAKVDALTKALQIKIEPPKTDCWMNIDELTGYLPDHPAKATVYGWVSNRQIPHHKGGKKLRFLKSEIDEWLSSGKRKTNGEIMGEAEEFIRKRNRK